MTASYITIPDRYVCVYVLITFKYAGIKYAGRWYLLTRRRNVKKYIFQYWFSKKQNILGTLYQEVIDCMLIDFLFVNFKFSWILSKKCTKVCQTAISFINSKAAES